MRTRRTARGNALVVLGAACLLLLFGATTAGARSFGAPQQASRTIAVVVGVDDYPDGVGDLRFSVRDADVAASALTRAGVPPSDVTVLRDRAAFTASIWAALASASSRATKDTTIVLFFAGHAQHVGSTHSFIAADGGLISDAEMARLFAHTRASHMLITMATCFGAGFDELLAPGRVLVGAAGANDRAYESDDLRDSYLVQALLRDGLGGDFSSRSVQSAFQRGTKALAREHPDRLPVMVSQSPEPLFVVRAGRRLS